ncbi:MAG: hypothetical protein ACOYBX_04905 [Mycobacterium sp.]
MTSSESDGDELALAAEAEVAEAEARAEAARARAADLRRQLADLEAQNPADQAETPTATKVSPARLITSLVAALATLALVSATGYMFWQHHSAEQQRRQAAEYAASARQGVINLMSVDYATAQDTVQRVIDGSTGRFRSNFEETADDFVKALQEEKIVTTATVNDAAVESITGNSAVVLVSATSQREGAQAPKSQQQPRVWRVVVTMERDGDQMKMSAVEFV